MGKHAATPPLPVRLARAEEAAMLSQLCIGSKAVWGYDEAFMAPSRIRARGQATTNRARRRVGGECRRWKCCGDGGTGTGRRADTLDLDKLFVEPKWIRTGVGHALLAHAIIEAGRRGADRFTILSDPYAAGFYERNGARWIGEAPSDAIPGRSVPLYEIKLD
jgi:GNAT superfamily N-acetyltransferase